MVFTCTSFLWSLLIIAHLNEVESLKLQQSSSSNSIMNSQFYRNIIKKSCNFVLPVALIISSTQVQPTYAVEASKLFAQAEQGILLTQQQYKTVENDWKTSKKKIIESSKNLGKSSELIKAVSNDLIDLEANVNKFKTDADNVITALTNEIERLKVSTATKFETASVAQASGTKLNQIQKLFKEAENEAVILDQESNNLKRYKEALSSNNLILVEKTKAVSNDLKIFLTRADDVQILQGNGLALLTEGLTKNVNACHYGGPQCVEKDQNGLALFKKGYDVIGDAQDDFQKLTKDIQRDFKDIEFIQNQFIKLSSQMHAFATSMDTWEQESKLKTPVGKSVVKISLNSIDKAVESSKKTTENFFLVDEKLLGKKDKSASETEKSVKNSLLSTLSKLETAEKEGKLTERLLREATAQGNKEAKMYLKYTVPKPPSSAAAAVVTASNKK